MPDLIQYFDGTATTQVDISGVLDQVVGLVPYVLPVLIGFIALRKGLSFIRNALTGA